MKFTVKVLGEDSFVDGCVTSDPDECMDYIQSMLGSMDEAVLQGLHKSAAIIVDIVKE